MQGAAGTLGYRAKINLRAWAGVAKPNPKMGQSLGPLGINMMQFCKDFNAKTQHIRPDIPLRVVLTAFHDRSYTFIIKPPQTTWFLKKALGVEKLSPEAGSLGNLSLSIKYLYEIALIKKEMDPHLQHVPVESIVRMIVAQTKSCGIYLTPRDTAPTAIIKPPAKIQKIIMKLKEVDLYVNACTHACLQ